MAVDALDMPEFAFEPHVCADGEPETTPAHAADQANVTTERPDSGDLRSVNQADIHSRSSTATNAA
jgi:hypothetical protein